MRLSKKKLKYIRRHAARKSPEEIAKVLGIPLKEVREALAARRGAPESEPSEAAGSSEERGASFLSLATPFLERAPYWGVFALVVTVPFVVVPGLRDYSNLPKSAFAQLGALAVAFVWLVGAGIRKDCRLAGTSLGLPLLAFIGWALASLTWGHNAYEALLVWSRWAAGGLVFLLTVNVVRSRRDARVLLWGLLGSGAVVALQGICQYLLKIGRSPPLFPPGFFARIWHLGTLRWIPQSHAPAASFGNPNFAAQYVVLAMPLGAGLFLAARTRAGEWLAALACSLMGVYLVYATTKAGMVAVGVEVAFVAALLLWERPSLRSRFSKALRRLGLRPPEGTQSRAVRRRGSAAAQIDRVEPGSFEEAALHGRGWNRTAALVSAAVLALVLANLTPGGFRWKLGGLYRPVSVLLYRPDDTGKDLSRPAATRAEAEYRSSIHYRLILWGNTLEMIKDHPVLGVGIGNWRVRYVGYSSRFALDEGVTSRKQPGRAHNDHLQVLAELGLVGAALYLWLGYAVYRAIVRALARGRQGERETRYLAMAVAAGVVGILVDASFSLPFQLAVPPLIVMAYLGILGGVLARPPVAEREDAESSDGARGSGSVRLPAWAFYSAAAVVAALFALHFLAQRRRIIGDWHFRKMDFASVRGDWGTVVAEGEQASEYDPRRKKTLVTVAGGHIRLARSDRTIEAKRGRLENAVAMLKEVVGAYPCNLKAYNHLGVAYMEIAELERKASPARRSALETSLAYFKRALEIRPEYADVHCNLASVYDKLGKPGEAVRSLGRALRYDPENPMLLKNMAIAWTKRKDLDKALVFYRRAVKARSLLFGADLSLLSDLESGRLSGRFLRRFKARRVSLSKNVAISREKEGGPWRISDLGTGRTYFAEEADKVLRVYVQKDDASVYGAIAGIHMSRGEVAGALRNYRLAAKLDPRNATFQHELGVSAFRVRRYREAKAAFQNTLRLKPGWALAHKNLGMVQVGFLGEKDEGLRNLKEALRLNPEVAGAVKVRDILRRYGVAP